jgi:hypothetical protein
MGAAALLVLLAVIVVNVLRSKAVHSAKAEGVPPELVPMPRRLENCIWIGFGAAAIARLLGHFGSDDALRSLGLARASVSDVSLVIAFGFMGTANLLDLLRLRQLAS